MLLKSKLLMTKIKRLLRRFGIFNHFKYFLNRKKLHDRILQQELAENVTWRIGIRTFETNVQLQEVHFVFGQAEKLLKDSVEDSQQVVLRTNILMTILGGALIFLGGHIGGILSTKNIHHIQNVNWHVFIRYHITFIPACSLAAIFLFLLLRLSKHLITLNYYTVGSQPKQLFVRQYYEGNSEIPIIIEMYLGELEEYQNRITENIAKNERRWNEVNSLIKDAVLYLILIISMLLFELAFCI